MVVNKDLNVKRHFAWTKQEMNCIDCTISKDNSCLYHNRTIEFCGWKIETTSSF